MKLHHAASLFLLIFSSPVLATQTVFLDFDTETGGTEHVYTVAERDAVESMMAGHYAPWDFSFSQTAPGGDFSTVFFNKGGPGGLADKIDFRNLDPNDTAAININGLLGGSPTSAEIISGSAIIGSHELGHLQGCRHGDSFGPIGFGIWTTPGPGPYFPDYPGSVTADETTDHLMASPASVGSSIGDLFTPSWFSERSAVKLTFNEDGTVLSEAAGDKDTLATAQAIFFDPLLVPNTIVSGDNAGLPDFAVDALTVTGSLSVAGEFDLYSFVGSADDLFNFEVISGVIDDRLSAIDPTITVLDSGGTIIPYYTSTAYNDDEFESFDSILIDLVLPDDDTYFLRVGSYLDAFDGDYELFGYRFNGAVPEPSTFAIWGLGLVLVLGVARRRREKSAW